MSNTLVNALSRDGNVARTLNGALSYQSTLDPVLDYYSQVGGLQGRPKQALKLFQAAYVADPLLARKAMFYTRDVPGRGRGLGERQLFRNALDWVAQNDPQTAIDNIDNIPFYGRFDDVLVLLLHDATKQAAIDFIGNALTSDLYALQSGEPVSLAAKWAPSENASSKGTKALGRMVRMGLGWSSARYRKTLSKLRAAITAQGGMVETLLTERRANEIDFSKVPSRAMYIYGRKGGAFQRQDGERYNDFIAAAADGEAKINAATLYPYELVERPHDAQAEAQWRALPNYMDGKNMLVVADTSGSMAGGFRARVAPIQVSLSLAVYAAERNTGAFQNRFFIFSERPKFVTMTGDTLAEKLRSLPMINSRNTDLQSVFDQLLNTAVANNVPDGEMPEMVVIISDMQFDQADGRWDVTNHEAMKRKYAAAGYTMPVVVYWNVNAIGGDSPVTANDYGVVLVSGFTPAVFQSMLEGDVNRLLTMTPVQAMVEALEHERYSRVV